MFTTGLMRLHNAGKVTNRHKGVHDLLSICTFALGTKELHDWLHEREDVRFLPVELVNEPGLIARNANLVSINGALSIDLYGQIAADALAGREHSGIGGHEDFVMGAAFSPGGRSLVCLPSTAKVAGKLVSRIVAELSPGTTVTTPRHQVDVVITEHGAAELAGRSEREKAAHSLPLSVHRVAGGPATVCDSSRRVSGRCLGSRSRTAVRPHVGARARRPGGSARPRSGSPSSRSSGCR